MLFQLHQQRVRLSANWRYVGGIRFLKSESNAHLIQLVVLAPLFAALVTVAHMVARVALSRRAAANPEEAS